MSATDETFLLDATNVRDAAVTDLMYVTFVCYETESCNKCCICRRFLFT